MTARYLKSLSVSEFQNFIDSIDVVLSDCDGVLWSEGEVIPGSPEAVAQFRSKGKKFFYVTNNNTKTRQEFLKKCESMNYHTSMNEIVCTSFLAAEYLKGKNFNKKVYLVGNEGIAKELEFQNIKSFGIGPDLMIDNELTFLRNFKPDPEVGAVVIGFDKHFSYPKLVKATTYLNDPKVLCVGTNCDIDRPSPNTNSYPGTGCFVKIIETASKRTATMVGKPGEYLSNYILEKFVTNPERTLMIGDNCDTDIMLGKRCGFKTLLVLSGVTTKADVDAMKMENKRDEDLALPDFYTDTLGDIID